VFVNVIHAKILKMTNDWHTLPSAPWPRVPMWKSISRMVVQSIILGSIRLQRTKA